MPNIYNQQMESTRRSQSETSCEESRAEEVRKQHVDLFLQVKQHLKGIPRDVLFLALAICDHFIEQLDDIQLIQAEDHQQRSKRALGCLTIAYKFLSSDKITLRVLNKLLPWKTISGEELVQEEADILEIIDYEVPTDTTYASMVRYFYESNQSPHEQMGLATRCLAFYRQAIQHSSDFVLCSELGPEICKAIGESRTEDPRIKRVCDLLKQKRDSGVSTPKKAL